MYHYLNIQIMKGKRDRYFLVKFSELSEPVSFYIKLGAWVALTRAGKTIKLQSWKSVLDQGGKDEQTI